MSDNKRHRKSTILNVIAGIGLCRMYLHQGLESIQFYDVKAIFTPQRDYYDACIVGAGLSGVVIAEQFASQLAKNSIIVEKRDHIGGNIYDYFDEETNILVNKYGAHLFHTNNPRDGITSSSSPNGPSMNIVSKVLSTTCMFPSPSTLIQSMRYSTFPFPTRRK